MSAATGVLGESGGPTGVLQGPRQGFSAKMESGQGLVRTGVFDQNRTRTGVFQRPVPDFGAAEILSFCLGKLLGSG